MRRRQTYLFQDDGDDEGGVRRRRRDQGEAITTYLSKKTTSEYRIWYSQQLCSARTLSRRLFVAPEC